MLILWLDCDLEGEAIGLNERMHIAHTRTLQQRLDERVSFDQIVLMKLLFASVDCHAAAGYEVMSICQEANPRLRVQRAHFSALIPRSVGQRMRRAWPRCRFNG
jgi:DNA topoisomerase IA